MDYAPEVNAGLPHSLEAEQALLGSILVNNAGVDIARRVIQPDDFIEPVHSRIYAEILRRVDDPEHEQVGPQAIMHLFRDDPALEEVEGPRYLVRLAEAASPIVNVRPYAETIADCAARRVVAETGQAIYRSAADLNDNAAFDTAVADQFTRLRERLAARSPIQATAHEWEDEAALPTRPWVYGKHLCRGYVSVTVAPGGVGKSALTISDALAMVSGQALMGTWVHGAPKNVWMFNLEDPRDELRLRIAAARRAHRVGDAAGMGRLYVDSGRDTPLHIAVQERDHAVVAEPLIDALVDELRRREINVLIVDPFVSSHQVDENKNGPIDAVVKAWGRVAGRANCAVELVHHVRKLNGAEVDADSARGAVSLIGAARSVRVLNRMTEEEATQARIEPAERWRYVRVHGDKANLAPPEAGSWFQLETVDLANGESVGAATRWEWPDLFANYGADDLLAVQRAVHGQGLREHPQSDAWVGHTIAPLLGLDSHDRGDRKLLQKMVKAWIGSGAFRVVEVKDPRNRMTKPGIEVGEWATS
jgi:RecA-family ATPase